MAGFAVRHPSGTIVHPYQWQANSEYSDQTSTGGYYGVCIDNQFSRFAGKLVNMYITVIKYEEWDKYAKEIEALQLDMQNFTVSRKWRIKEFEILTEEKMSLKGCGTNCGEEHQRYATIPIEQS